MEINVIGKEYFNQTLELFNKVFNRNEGEEFWNNKHYSNPVGDSVFVGMFDNEALIAINAFSPMEYVYKGETYRVLQSCESAVDSNYRHRGIFSQLITFAQEWAKDNGYDFLIGMPNIYSYPGFVKLDWDVELEKKVYARIVDFKGWKNWKKKTGLRPIADMMLIANQVKNAFRAFKKDVSISPISSDEFISTVCKNSNRMCCKYTKEYLEWKLGKKGKIYKVEKDDIAIVLVVKHGAIVFFDDMNNETGVCSALVDCFCRKNVTKDSLISSAELYMRDGQEIATKCGFVSKRWAPTYMIVKRISDRANAMNDFEWEIRSLEEV